MSARSTAVFAALVVVATLIAWGFTLGLPLTGADVWPILAQGKRFVDAPLQTLGERYLEGLWEGARFWRPGVVAVAGVQHAAFGESAWLYHASRLAFVALTAIMVGLLAAAHGRVPRVAFGVAAALYLLHPVQAETIPAVARDADTYFTLATVAALLALVSSRESRSSARTWIGVLSALLAPTFKEPGLLAPLLGVLVLEPWRGGDTGVRRARIASLVLLAGLAAHVFFRWSLLGTVGGYESAVIGLSTGEAARVIGFTLFDHQRLGFVWPAALGLAGAALVASGLGVPRHERTTSRAWPRLRLATLAWFFVSTLAFLQASRVVTRYSEALLAPLAILAGAWISQLVDETRLSRRDGENPLRATLASAAAVLALVVVLAGGSPPLWRYPQWELAGRTSDAVSAAVVEAAKAARMSGREETVRIGRFTVTAAPAPGDAMVVAIDPFPYKTTRPAGSRDAELATVVIMGQQSIYGLFELRGLGPLRGVRMGQAALDVAPDDFPEEKSP